MQTFQAQTWLAVHTERVLMAYSLACNISRSSLHLLQPRPVSTRRRKRAGNVNAQHRAMRIVIALQPMRSQSYFSINAEMQMWRKMAACSRLTMSMCN